MSTPTNEYHWLFFNRSTEGQRLIYCGYYVELGTQEIQEQWPSLDCDLDVFAYSVTIKDKIVLPGRNIRIFAQTVTTQQGAAIVVDGKLGAPTFAADEAAASGRNSGEAGRHGDEGGTGGGGGNVDVRCAILDIQGTKLEFSAQGGKGGNGLNAGHGIAGAPGEPGADSGHWTGHRRSSSEDGDFSGAPGGDGQGGGAGGNGGRGGDGGPAGKIDLYAAEVNFAERLKIFLDGGEAGLGGRGGRGAPGGAGAAGGRTVSCSWSEPLDRGRGGGTSCQMTNRRAASGRQGREGGAGAPGANGTKGVSGRVVQTLGRSGDGVLAVPSWPAEWPIEKGLSYLELLLQRANLSFLNEEIEIAFAILNWIVDLTSLPPLDGVAGDIRARVVTLLSRIRQGLDFYGNQRHSVPRLRKEVFEDAWQRKVELGQALERIEERYRNRATERSILLADLRAEVSRLGFENGELGAGISATKESLAAKDKAIQDLFVRQNVLVEKLQQSSAAFQDAVRRAENNCDLNFGQILSTAIKFVPYVGTAMQTFSSVKSMLAGDKFKNLEASYQKTLKAQKEMAPEDRTWIAPLWYQKITAVADQGTAGRDLVNNIRTTLVPNPDPNAGYAMSETQHADLLEKYKDLPEAAPYREQLSQMEQLNVDLANAKGEYDSLVVAIAEAYAQQAANRRLILSTEQKLAQNFDPRTNELAVFFGRQLFEAKQGLVHVLYDMHRALRFWSVDRTSDFEIDGRLQEAVAALGVHYDRYKDKIRQRMNEWSAPGNLHQNFQISWKKADHPELFAALATNQRLVLLVSPEVFLAKGYAKVFALAAGCVVKGLRTGDTMLNVMISHLGSSSFIREDGTTLSFTHGVIQARQLCPIQQAETFALLPLADENYAPAAAAASWQLDFTRSVQPDFSGVTEIVLRLNLLAKAVA